MSSRDHGDSAGRDEFEALTGMSIMVAILAIALALAIVFDGSTLGH